MIACAAQFVQAVSTPHYDPESLDETMQADFLYLDVRDRLYTRYRTTVLYTGQYSNAGMDRNT
jgi:hypothetical protein